VSGLLYVGGVQRSAQAVSIEEFPELSWHTVVEMPVSITQVQIPLVSSHNFTRINISVTFWSHS
jgi:hypothetical protein